MRRLYAYRPCVLYSPHLPRAFQDLSACCCAPGASAHASAFSAMRPYRTHRRVDHTARTEP
eukprot:7298448-Pyramimonas_sp.AAC.1